MSKVKIRNYKVIKEADIEIKPITILIGPNGSGKSSFIEALNFFRANIYRDRKNLDEYLVQNSWQGDSGLYYPINNKPFDILTNSDVNNKFSSVSYTHLRA
ncbi:MAG: AAA family ATPase, partial [Ignavibacteriaceae bacterium]|nr:AAA family ATPase [Ignavibacteriaceae bacterium]